MEKKLYRSRDKKLICGVCAGIGEYFNIDPTVIHLAFALFTCMGGSGILAYLIASVIMPPKPE